MCAKQEANKLADMDKMISIKGLVIRTTPVIPDMKTGMKVKPSNVANQSANQSRSIFPVSSLQSCSECIS